MLSKLLFKQLNPIHTIIALGGSIIGMSMLLISLQIYFNIQQMFKNDDSLLRPEYIVINKPVSIFKTLSMRKPAFKDKEIKELENLEFISKVVPFVPSRFRVTIFTEEHELLPNMYTLVFFESIPDEYLDFDRKKWKWREGSEDIVPIAIPRDYLNLYNFGFAPSQNLPQLSQNVINQLPLKLQLKGNGKNQYIKCRIVAFSNRINTILVPKKFLDWANLSFGNKKGGPSGRLLLVTDNPSDSRLYQYIQEKGYETNVEKLKNSKIAFILKMVMSLIGVVATIIIVLAFIVFILTFQQLITKSSKSIQNLIYIGFNRNKIALFYIYCFGIILIIISFIASIITFLIELKIGQIFNRTGLAVDGGINFLVVLAGFVISLLLFVINSLLIVGQVRKLS